MRWEIRKRVQSNETIRLNAVRAYITRLWFCYWYRGNVKHRCFVTESETGLSNSFNRHPFAKLKSCAASFGSIC